jgi:phosphonate C-P lyase system protein PhnG
MTKSVHSVEFSEPAPIPELKERFLKAWGSSMEQDLREGMDEALEHLLDALWEEGPIAIRKPPHTELVMATVMDPFQTPFHLGEVLVTCAEVSWKEVSGCAMILGERPKEAILLACLDVMGDDVPMELTKSIQGLLLQVEAWAREHQERLSKMSAATTVQFESMKKERVDFGSLGG